MQSLKAVSTETTIGIYREGEVAPRIVQQAERNQRPFIHPIIAPGGSGEMTENSPPHHPWQHGLYTGLNLVNGYGFWEEGVNGHPLDGTFHPQPLAPAAISESGASWQVETEWRAPEGSPLLTETQKWTFTDCGTIYVLDLQWTLSALTDLHFGKHTYGGLFLRMPYRKHLGGYVRNSEGLLNAEAEGRPARWNVVSMPLDGDAGKWGSMAMMDHPDNPGHPVSWRVDNQLGIAPSRCIGGDRTLPQGQSERYTYRLIVLNDQPDFEQLDHYWDMFAESK